MIFQSIETGGPMVGSWYIQRTEREEIAMRITGQGGYTAGIDNMSDDELRAHIVEMDKVITEKEEEAKKHRKKSADKGTEVKAKEADIRALKQEKAEAEAIAESRQVEIRRQEQLLQNGGEAMAVKDREIERLVRESEDKNPVTQAVREEEAARIRRETTEADAEAANKLEAQARRKAILLNLWLRFVTGFFAALTAFIPVVPLLFSKNGYSPWLHVVPPLTAFIVFFLFPGLAAWLKRISLAIGEFIVNVISFVVKLFRNITTWILVRVGISDVALIGTAYEESRKEWANTPLTEKIAKIFLRFCGVFVAVVVCMSLWPEKLSAHGLFVAIAGGIAAMSAFEYFVGLMLKVSFRDGYKWWAIVTLYLLGITVSAGSAMVTFSELYYRNAESLLFSEVRSDVVEAENAYLKVAQGICEDGITTAERKAKEAKAEGDKPKAEAKTAEAQMFRKARDGMLAASQKGKSAEVWADLDSSAKEFKEAGTTIAGELGREDRKKDLLGKIFVPKQPSAIQLGTRVILGTELEGIRTRFYSGPLWLAAALVFIFEGAVILIGLAALVMRLGTHNPTKRNDELEAQPATPAA